MKRAQYPNGASRDNDQHLYSSPRRSDSGANYLTRNGVNTARIVRISIDSIGLFSDS
jgi:hypothetical protein